MSLDWIWSVGGSLLLWGALNVNMILVSVGVVWLLIMSYLKKKGVIRGYIW